MRKLIFTLVIAITLAIAAMSAAASGQYVASKIRAPFHLATCKWAQKIDPQNLVWYSTREAAIADGHCPCKVCNP